MAGADSRARAIARRMALDAVVHTLYAHGTVADLLAELVEAVPVLKDLTSD